MNYKYYFLAITLFAFFSSSPSNRIVTTYKCSSKEENFAIFHIQTQQETSSGPEEKPKNKPFPAGTKKEAIIARLQSKAAANKAAKKA